MLRFKISYFSFKVFFAAKKLFFNWYNILIANTQINKKYINKMFPIINIIIAAGALLLKVIVDSNKETTKAYEPPPPPKVENIICFIGRVSAGKSSTANALLGFQAFKTGIEHGSTNQSLQIDYKMNYKILDTPGLMDNTNQESEAIYRAERSKIVVYVTDRQLYRKELDFIKKLKTYYLRNNTLILYVNKEDEKENFMSTTNRKNEQKLIIDQVSEWIPQEHIAFGASSPKENGIDIRPRIVQLEKLINKFM